MLQRKIHINDDKKQIHKLKRNAFLNYETWRKERAIEFKKEIPKETTINQEISCLRRVFLEVVVTHDCISKSTVPDILSIRPPKDQKHRRDTLTAKAWEDLERLARLYWIKLDLLDTRFYGSKN